MDMAEQARKVLASLTPREEKVLRLRFGIGERSEHTLEAVGQDFAVTRERLRQIEAKALTKLRQRVPRLRVLVEDSLSPRRPTAAQSRTKRQPGKLDVGTADAPHGPLGWI